MQLKILTLANAGIYLEAGNRGILIDGVFRGREAGWSDLPPELYRKMLRKEAPFEKLTDLLFTHTHPDHYNADAVKRLYNEVLLSTFLPSLVMTGGVRTVRMLLGDIHAAAVSTRHEGDAFTDVIHCSYLIQYRDKAFWFAGDAELTEETANTVKSLWNHKISAGFFNPYQFVNRQSAEFIRELPFEELYMYHAPYPEEDGFGYYVLAEAVMRSAGTKFPGLKQLHPGETLQYTV